MLSTCTGPHNKSSGSSLLVHLFLNEVGWRSEFSISLRQRYGLNDLRTLRPLSPLAFSPRAGIVGTVVEMEGILNQGAEACVCCLPPENIFLKKLAMKPNLWGSKWAS